MRAATRRLADFDGVPQTLRHGMNAAGMPHGLRWLWRDGVRTFEDAEKESWRELRDEGSWLRGATDYLTQAWPVVWRGYWFQYLRSRLECRAGHDLLYCIHLRGAITDISR